MHVQERLWIENTVMLISIWCCFSHECLSDQLHSLKIWIIIVEKNDNEENVSTYLVDISVIFSDFFKSKSQSFGSLFDALLMHTFGQFDFFYRYV